MSKGSNYRPTDTQKYSTNYDLIFRNKNVTNNQNECDLQETPQGTEAWPYPVDSKPIEGHHVGRCGNSGS